MPSNKRLWIAIPLVSLLGLALAIYWPALHGLFLFDDGPNILNNKGIKIATLDPTALRKAAFSVQSGPLYRPISYLSFALDYYLAGGLDPFAFKLTNALIHLFVALGLFLLARRLLPRLYAMEGFDVGERRGLLTALFITGLWLLHPFHVSTVLYTVQRMAQLAALFVVWSALAYVHGREALLEGRKRGMAWILGALAVGGTLATLSKENGALLPVFLLVIEAFFFRFQVHASLGAWPRRLILAGLGVPAALIFGYLAWEALHLVGGIPFRHFTLSERLLTEARILLFYLRLIIFPDITRMGMYHDDIPLSRGLFDPPTTLLALLAIAALLSTAFHALRRPPWAALGFGILWFFGGHVLESTVLPLELVFEHRNYLPSIGPLFALGYYLTYPSMPDVRPIFQGAAALTVLTVLAYATHLRVAPWEDDVDFLLNELDHHPRSARVFYEVGVALQRRGMREDSLPYLEEAARLVPWEPGYKLAIAGTLLFMGKEPGDELSASIEETLRTGPISAFDVRNLAYTLEQAAERQEKGMILGIQRALEANERFKNRRKRLAAAYFLGKALFKVGLKEEARDTLRAALKEGGTRGYEALIRALLKKMGY